MIAFALRLAGAALLATSVIAPAHAQPIPPLDAYGDLPAIESAEISASGAHSAVVMTVQGQRQVLVFDNTGKPIRQFVIGDAKVRFIEWVGDEAILLIRSETGRTGLPFDTTKQEWFRANVLPLDPAGEVVSVFAKQRKVANAIIGFDGVREVDGRWMGYFGGFRMGRSSGEDPRILDDRPALFAVDLRTGAVDQIAYPSEWPVLREWLVGDDGKVAATLDINSETGKWQLRGPSGKLVEGVSPRGSVDLIGLGAAGDSVIYHVFDEEEGTAKRFEIPLAGGQPKRVYRGLIERWVRDPLTGRVLGMIDRQGKPTLADQEREAALEKTLGLFSRGHMRLAGYTPDLATIIARTSGNYDSGSWYRVDTASGQRMMMGLERPAIQGRAIGKIRTFDYTAADGLEIEAVLTLPPGREPVDLPVVILPHGGPTAHDEPVFDWWAQAFASRGYAVLQPNFRGSTNRGEEFRSAGDGEWGRKMQTDLSDGLAALDAAGIADADRACIVGASYGGYAALAGVTLQDGIYRCAVAVNAVADLRSIFRSELTGQRTIFQTGVEKLLGEDADLNALSPARQADRANAPVLLIHGRDDTRVPYEQAARMEDALSDAGKDVTLITLDGEDHFLSSAETRKRMLLESVQFVERHNPAD